MVVKLGEQVLATVNTMHNKSPQYVQQVGGTAQWTAQWTAQCSATQMETDRQNSDHGIWETTKNKYTYKSDRTQWVVWWVVWRGTTQGREYRLVHDESMQYEVKPVKTDRLYDKHELLSI